MQIKFERKDNRNRTKNKLDFSGINEAVRKNAAKVVQPKEVHINLQNSYQLNMKGFIGQFKNINSMNDQDLMNFVRITYLDVLEASNIRDTQPDEETQLELVNIFTNPKFLNAMRQIITSYPLDFAHSVYLNDIIYQYLINNNNNSDPLVKDLYIQLAQLTSVRLITTLTSCNIDKSLATTLAIAVGSSFDDHVRTRRLNKILVSTPCNYTLQNIVDVYQHCLGSCVTKLFVATMFQLFDKSIMNEQQVYTDGLLNDALLVILSSLPSHSIKLVLQSYANFCLSNNKYVRFSMNNLYVKYPRIHKAVLDLNQDGIYLP